MKDKGKITRWIILTTGILFFLLFFGLSVFYSFIPNIKELGNKNIKIVIFTFLIISFLYLLFSILYFSLYETIAKNKRLLLRLDNWSAVSFHISGISDEVVNELPVGILVTSNDNKCEWHNEAIRNIFQKEITGKNLVELIPELEDVLDTKKEKITVKIEEEKYEIIIRRKHNAYYFFNVTEREDIKSKFKNRMPVIGIIILDNLEESIASLDIAVQASTRGLYLSAITDWALKYKAFLKTYNNDKMFFITYKETLDKMIADEFSILETVREISFNNNILVTLSIGIASWDLSMPEMSLYAQNAVELAEKRGGDQVVLNVEGSHVQYFGAKIDQSSTSSKVSARVSAENLKKLVKGSKNVFIMGHKNTDTDSYAAMLVVANMLKADGKENVKLVIDDGQFDQTVSKIYDIQINEEKFLIDDIITSDEAIKNVDDDTLLIVVDTQSKNLVSSYPLLEKVKQEKGIVAIIDHHRAADDSFRGDYEYIEPSSSSTTELLIELLDFYTLKKERMTPFLATILYSGIIVDTNNFSQRTGARTFEVASRLKEFGADISTVRKWLRKDMERLFLVNDLISSANFLLDKKVAIASLNEINKDPVLAAQVADSLLQIDGVEVSFAVIRCAEKEVAVSARSIGSYNVQIVMEQLGGGGHFSAAAGRFKEKTVEEVIKLLETQIDLEYNEEGEKMKIILLSDIKGRGNKNDIIEVKQGYANYLIKEKLATLATEEAIKKLEELKEAKEKSEKENIRMLKRLAEEIKDKAVSIKVAVGNDGKLFGSVTNQDIAVAFLEQNKIAIDKRKIKLASEIVGVGTYQALVSLGYNINTSFNVFVTEK